MIDHMITPCSDARKATRLAPQRDKLGHWLPGQTGNPGGRPKIPRDIRVAQTRDWPAVYQSLVDLATGAADEKVRLDAIKEFLNRWQGRPAEMGMTGADSLTMDMAGADCFMAGRSGWGGEELARAAEEALTDGIEAARRMPRPKPAETETDRLALISGERLPIDAGGGERLAALVVEREVTK